MQKRHFEYLADELAAIRPPLPTISSDDDPRYVEWRAAVAAVANACRAFNPNFDRDRFIEACKARRSLR